MATLESPGVFTTVVDGNMSYFEEMQYRAEHGRTAEERTLAAKYVDEMVDEMNKAEQEERMATASVSEVTRNKAVQELVEHIAEDIGNELTAFWFEPNDEATQEAVYKMAAKYLAELTEHRVIRDFKVVCSSENNPQSVIDQDRLVLNAYIKPYGAHEHAIEVLEWVIQPGLVTAFDDDPVAVDEDDAKPYNPNAPKSGPMAPKSTQGSHRTNGGYPAGNGTIGGGGYSLNGSPTLGGTVTISAGGGAVYSIAPPHGIVLSKADYDEPKMKIQSDSDSLPIVMLQGEDDSGNWICMELQPEASINASDAFKLTQLLRAYDRHSHEFSVYRYVKKHNLERHFKFSA